MFGIECPNRGFIEEVYGTAPNLLYEVRVVCKGNIERYEHYFLIRQSLVIRVEKKTQNEPRKEQSSRDSRVKHSAEQSGLRR